MAQKTDVLYKLKSLVPSGKSERSWKIKLDDKKNIEDIFEAYKKNKET